ncbi:MAG: DUF4440 domain-containing protein [Cyclobacteriaceae bacterium]
MKQTFLILIATLVTTSVYSQETITTKEKLEITFLIDQYSKAREKQDTVQLKSILTKEVDQLVSSGEWRMGIGAAVTGMLRSSDSNAGSRKLIVEKIRFITTESGLVDARYEIQNPDGTVRKMWSTFVVVRENKKWKITAIRNMLPSQ